MLCRISQEKAEEMETEGKVESLQLRKSPRKVYHESCEAWANDEGWFHMEVGLTPKKHECAYNYKVM